MDPSQGMIEAARATLKSDISPLLGSAATDETIKTAKQCSIKYVQGSAEDLSDLEANSIDLVTSGKRFVGLLRP
jgi:ubiquinone/menaquinone biosynthesis C-methylase UbiE